MPLESRIDTSTLWKLKQNDLQWLAHLRSADGPTDTKQAESMARGGALPLLNYTQPSLTYTL